MSSQRSKRVYDYDKNHEKDGYRDQRNRNRSTSRSRSNRYGRRENRSRSRSRSHSLERRKHRKHHSSHSRQHYRDSRSRSRSHSKSRSRNYTHSRRHSRSRTPTRSRRDRQRSRSQSSNRQEQNIQKMTQIRSIPEENTTSSNSSYPGLDISLENLPLPKQEEFGAYYDLDTDEPFDKARIHREIEEKLRETLAREGKVYPPPKPEASHPVFANDGSFLEIFKKMQQSQKPTVSVLQTEPIISVAAPSTSTAPYAPVVPAIKSVPPPPLVGRRRGGKILKTGMVAKPKAQLESNSEPKDFWSLYLAEVNKYKNTACESDGGTRPLVK